MNNHPDLPGHKNLTTRHDGESVLQECVAENVLRLLTGKWKPQVIQLASQGTVRFNSLLRKIPGSNKQSLSVAIRELEEANVLDKKIVSQKPLHIEYSLTERGRAMIDVFRVAASVAKNT
jgi:DNA-binding HxlR family transcriptional regulator